MTAEYHRVDVRFALKDLFKKVGLACSFEPAVTGNISARLPRMPFRDAFLMMLSSSFLTYRVEGGVYQVIRRSRSEDERKWIDTHASDLIQKTGLPKVPAPAVRSGGGDVGEVFWSLLSKSDQYYVIGTGVHGPLDATAPAQGLADTIAFLAGKSGCWMSYKSGVWILGDDKDAPLGELRRKAAGTFRNC